MQPGVLAPCSPPSRVPRCSQVPLCPHPLPQGTQVSGLTVQVEELADNRLGRFPQATGNGSWSRLLNGQTEGLLWIPIQLPEQCHVLCAQLGHGDTSAPGTQNCAQAHKGTCVLHILDMSPPCSLQSLQVPTPPIPHACTPRDAQPGVHKSHFLHKQEELLPCECGEAPCSRASHSLQEFICSLLASQMTPTGQSVL